MQLTLTLDLKTKLTGANNDYRLGKSKSLLIVISILLSTILATSAQQISAEEGIEETADNEQEVGFVYGGNTSSFGQIAGQYSDPSLGLEMEFPEGWSGFGFPGLAMVNPSGSTLFGAPNETRTTMMIASINVTQTPPRLSSMPPDSSSQPLAENNTLDCTFKLSYEKLNDLIVMHSFDECKDPGDKSKYSVSNIYNAARKGQIIGVGLTSNSVESYKEYIDDFEKSLLTLKITDAIDHRTVWSEPLGMESTTYDVEAKGNTLHMNVDTNSEISGFNFDEDQKRISFRAEGKNGTFGLTVIPIGTILDGPYSVMIDGKPSMPVMAFDDQVANLTRIEVQYQHSAHDIAISGAAVVPEFPLSPWVILTAILGFGIFVIRLRWSGQPDKVI